MSIFLAMLLSVTRTISITKPFYKLQPTVILATSFAYCLAITLEPLFGMLPQIDYKYIYNGNNPNCYQSAMRGSVPYYIQYLMEAANILVATIITTVSFLITLYQLHILPEGFRGAEGSQFGRVSVTVAAFTAIFLVCNIPMFANVLLMTITEMVFEFPGPIFSPFYMQYYSWLVAKVVSVALNATLNPVLYFMRMSDLNKWVRRKAKAKERNSTTLGSLRAPVRFSNTAKHATVHVHKQTSSC